jgi:hypothetical protein
MLYEDEVFSIEPTSGDIWPNSEAEVTVLFGPRGAGEFTRTVYCDVTGRESRLPLKLKAEGAGPEVAFSFETLDMGSMFINSAHVFEVSPSLWALKETWVYIHTSPALVYCGRWFSQIRERFRPLSLCGHQPRSLPRAFSSLRQRGR